MSAKATTPDSGALEVGNLWPLEFEVRDSDDELVNATVVVTVTRPDGSTTTLATDNPSTGVYTSAYALAAAGRHTARAVVSGTVVAACSWAVMAEAIATIPDVGAIRAYVGPGAASWADADIQAAIDAEAAAQAKACTIGAVYPPNLVEALKRRVARNLGFRAIPLGVQPTADGLGAVPIGSNDPEVRRLEAPYRRKPVG